MTNISKQNLEKLVASLSSSYAGSFSLTVVDNNDNGIVDSGDTLSLKYKGLKYKGSKSVAENMGGDEFKNLTTYVLTDSLVEINYLLTKLIYTALQKSGAKTWAAIRFVQSETGDDVNVLLCKSAIPNEKTEYEVAEISLKNYSGAPIDFSAAAEGAQNFVVIRTAMPNCSTVRVLSTTTTPSS